MKKCFIKLLSLLMVLVLSLGAFAACTGDGTEDDSKVDEGGKDSFDVYIVEMEIENFGIIKLELLREYAPATVDNFVKLAEENFYDGLTIIRAQEGFVIQGGCPKKDGSGNSENTIPGEFAANGYYKNAIKHITGVISMARSDDPDSASCQFFITLGDARQSLDGMYAGFGYVADKASMEVVYAVAEAMYPYTEGSMGFVPDVENQPVIKDVRVVDKYNN